MESGTLLQDHLDAFNKLVMDLQTARIKKNEETLACAFLFSLTSKYGDIENSMMYSKEPSAPEQVWQELNSCDVRRHFKETKMMKLVGSVRLVSQLHTSARGRTSSKWLK
ncbi:hypothetical protein HAX54_047230 [Datura stramonium]|uniref:Uncharacterized protein n=1 Tax=Datura stramonium TaxID=4076 RepID=A0ABS8SSI3_DATST|nr:hypothetical protein [Datura stramonium]